MKEIDLDALPFQSKGQDALSAVAPLPASAGHEDSIDELAIHSSSLLSHLPCYSLSASAVSYKVWGPEVCSVCDSAQVTVDDSTSLLPWKSEKRELQVLKGINYTVVL